MKRTTPAAVALVLALAGAAALQPDASAVDAAVAAEAEEAAAQVHQQAKFERAERMAGLVR